MNQKVSGTQLERELLSLERQERLDALKSQQSKKQLINELKNGLGEEMKENPSYIEIIAPPKETFKDKLIKFFKRF